jgi:hypothetical protein
LYACVRTTIEHDLPSEADYLRKFDQFKAGVQQIVDMPERTLNNLVGILRQNGGRLSKLALENEFAGLTADEVSRLEQLYRTSFDTAG